MALEGLIPPALVGVGVEEFMARLTELDAPMLAKLEAARARNHVLRYVGALDAASNRATVGLVELERSHPFANINLTDNVVRFVTSRYDQNPLVVQGPGAGPAVTAGGVFADLLRVCSYLGAKILTHRDCSYMRRQFLIVSVLVCLHAPLMAQSQTATIRVQVRAADKPVVAAEVLVAGATHQTDASGSVTATVTPGAVELVVVKAGYVAATASVQVAAGSRAGRRGGSAARAHRRRDGHRVSSTRTDKRLEDQPMRVEVVPGEEVQEKLMMTPGDVSMLLNETNGLRVQTTSPSLGGANVRIQGLRGRYTQILADGLPLYGGQTGSIGLLQIPPMDLGQVEVIKGVASALYGMSAIGGVVNLVSRRPPAEGHEAEVLVNQTSHAGTDVVNWLAAPLGTRWGYTFVGGGHFAERSDLDDDGWTDLPMYRRVVARPRFFWEDGRGKSLLLAVGGMAEERKGGTMPGFQMPDGLPFEESLDTKRVDAGAVLRVATSKGIVVSARGSGTRQAHTHTFGSVDRARHAPDRVR